MQLLIQLRWLAVVGQVVTISLVHWGLDIHLPLGEMLAVLVGLVIINLACIWWLRWRQHDISSSDLFVALHRAFRAGRLDEACALQLRINRFMQALKQYGNRAYYAALQALGIDIGWPRRTGREIGRKELKEIELLVKELDCRGSATPLCRRTT